MYKNGKLIPVLILQKEHMRFFKIVLLIIFFNISAISHAMAIDPDQLDIPETDLAFNELIHKVAKAELKSENILLTAHRTSINTEALNHQIDTQINKNEKLIIRGKFLTKITLYSGIVLAAGGYFIPYVMGNKTTTKEEYDHRFEYILYTTGTIFGGLSWYIWQQTVPQLFKYNTYLDKQKNIL